MVAVVADIGRTRGLPVLELSFTTDASCPDRLRLLLSGDREGLEHKLTYLRRLVGVVAMTVEDGVVVDPGRSAPPVPARSHGDVG